MSEKSKLALLNINAFRSKTVNPQRGGNGRGGEVIVPIFWYVTPKAGLGDEWVLKRPR